MRLLPDLLTAVDVRKNHVLRIAQAALPENQFRAFRGLFLDEFGRNGLESDVAGIVANYEKLNGKDAGRPIHAGREVPHD